MNYMKYNRALVMLEEQNGSFCAKEGPVRGYLKVETGNGKGALRCTVQNLRYYPRGEYVYKLILFGKKGERTIHAIVGNLVVNRFGNSETYFRFNPVDVDDRGSSYSDYFTAIVAAVSTRDSTEALHPVLKGLLENEEVQGGTGPRPTAESLVKAASAEESQPESPAVHPGVGPEAAKRQEAAVPAGNHESDAPEGSGEPQETAPQAVQAKVAEPEAPNPETAPQAVQAPVAEPEAPNLETAPQAAQTRVAEPEAPNLETAPQAAQTPVAEPEAPNPETAPQAAQTKVTEPEAPNPETAPQAAQTPVAEPEAPNPETAPEPEAASSSQDVEEPHNYNGFYNEYLLNVCGYTCKVANYYEEVHPFESDRTGARWKKVVNVSNLPLVSPGAHHFAAQYRHYLFGARAGRDGKAERFYFGIPGRFLETEQPDGGRSGFTFWQPMRGADREKTAYGYWIVSVDGKTGNIEDV